jgi:hypothetical protein
VANLSVGGLFAATTRPPLKGQVVRLLLELGDRQSHEVVGTVTWINSGQKPKASDLPAGFGVRITRMAPASSRSWCLKRSRKADSRTIHQDLEFSGVVQARQRGAITWREFLFNTRGSGGQQIGLL